MLVGGGIINKDMIQLFLPSRDINQTSKLVNKSNQIKANIPRVNTESDETIEF